MPKKPRRTQNKTRIVVQMDEDFPSTLYLRGEGPAALNWDKGIALQHVKPDEWMVEIDESFSSGKFKVLINDQTYELGDSHHLYPGASIRVNPRFPSQDSN